MPDHPTPSVKKFAANITLVGLLQPVLLARVTLQRLLDELQRRHGVLLMRSSDDWRHSRGTRRTT